MNEIEIRIKVSGGTEAVAELKAVDAAAREMGSSSSGMGDVSHGLDDISRSAESAASKMQGVREASDELAAAASKGRSGTENAGSSTIEVPVKVADNELHREVQNLGNEVGPDAERAGTEISEKLADGFTRDSTGRMRDSMGRFVSSAQKDAESGGGIKVPLEVSADDFESSFRAAMDEGEKVSADADKTIRQSFTSIESGSRTLRAAMADLEPAADGAGNALQDAGNKAAGAGNGASSSGNGFAFLHSKVFLLTSAALALGPALAAVPAVLGAAALGAGTMALAFGGVIGALKDYAAQSANSAASGASSAATAFSNAVAIRNAEQAITDAKRQAAQQAQQSAAAIVAAQQAVGDAERQAAQQAQQSADSVAAANQHLAQSQQALTLAQQALTLAERDGVNVLKDLNLAAEDAANSVADSQNSVIDAQAAWDKAKGNSLLTDQQKREALQALIDAQQHLKDAQQKQTEAQLTANDANAKGVEGSTAVVNAQQSVQTAMQNVADAQHSLVVTQQTAANQQISSNESVAKAVQGLATAKLQAAQQAQASAEQVSKAEQALADMETQQALAAQAAGASQNKFAQDMAKLSQPARDLVNQVLGMKNGLHDLSMTAQTATLPGFTQMLRDSTGLFPTVNGGIRDMGTAISNTAIGFGNLMKSSAFQGQLHAVLKDAADLATQLGNGMVGMVGGITQAAAKAGPIVQGLGTGLSTIMGAGIPALLNGLVSGAPGAGQALGSIGTIISNLLGPIGTLAGAFSTALAPALQVLASPAVAQALQSIATSIGQILIVLSPLITLIAQGLAGALKILAPILQGTAQFLQQNHAWLVPLVGIVLGVVAALKLWAIAQLAINLLLTANPIGLVIAAIGALVIGLVYCWEHFKGFRDFMQAMWKDIKVGFDFFLAFVKQWWPELLAPFTGGVSLIIGHWDSIVDFTKKLPGRLVAAAAHIWDWIAQKWDADVAGPVSKGFDTFINAVIGLPGKLARAGAGMWDWLSQSFKSAINMIIGWWDSLSFTTPHFHIPGIGDTPSVTIGMPYISKFAAGGALGMGGLSAIIGDAGTELMKLPNGTQIMPHANTQSMLAQGAGVPVVRIELDWAPGSNHGDELLVWLRKSIRIRGGSNPNSVQLALGQTH